MQEAAAPGEAPAEESEPWVQDSGLLVGLILCGIVSGLGFVGALGPAVWGGWGFECTESYLA